jgi:OmcA/MtrC family decaheme c-type cytochrome
VDITTTTGKHAQAAAGTEYNVAITNVSTTGNNVTVTAHLTNKSGGANVTTLTASDASAFRFTFAQLDGSNTAASPANWVPHFKRTSGTAVQGYYQRANDKTGTFDVSQAASGLYSYTFGVGDGTYGVASNYSASGNITTSNPLVLTSMTEYSATATQRIGVEVRVSNTQTVNNGVCDFVVSGAASETCTGSIADGVYAGTLANQVVTTSACNVCHDADGDGNGLALHGGPRRQVEFCVTCHNSSTTDGTTGNTVNFKTMIHKIHDGKNLPSVAAGGSYGIGSHDYSKGAFPQEITNCAKCHTGGAYSTNWYAVPSIESCGSCHDDVDFTTGTNHAGGIKANGTCGNCHNSSATTAENPQRAHRQDKIMTEGNRWAYVINSVTYDSSTGGVTVNFQVNQDGSPVDLTGTPWTQGSASRLAVSIGWKASGKADYTNEGAGNTSTPGAPININVVNNGAVDSGVTAVGGNVYTVSTTLPDTGKAAGTGIAMLDGHPAVQTYTGWTDSSTGAAKSVYDRIPALGAFKEFAITASSVSARRSVVTTTNCSKCHDTLSLHGNNRTVTNSAGSSIELTLCTTCHNSANTDIAVRPTDGSATADGLVEASIDMKRMVHQIHKGADLTPKQVVIYGFGGSTHKFGGEFPPGTPLNSCTVCHASTTYYPPLTTGIEGTTVESGSIGVYTDDVNISPNTAVCSSCHDNATQKRHMESMGGSFKALETDISYE